ncbi:hypothetical protein [Lactococcus protaetiae]|uniref:hypothetical protein n=1 Tax=Lactococcus protaetiae TaxID=2592653 RepID=UPI0024781E16|nr:hypothetical protein [Lactococcus protaetiae]
MYDGTFSGQMIAGNGITAQLLADNGIEVITSSVGIPTDVSRTNAKLSAAYPPEEDIARTCLVKMESR